MKLLSVLHNLPLRAECVLNLFLFRLEGRAATMGSCQEQAWKIDYRTAGGFHCLYVGAPTAWLMLEWAPPTSGQVESSRGSPADDMAWCLQDDTELHPGIL
ncbi:hypothetical protein [Paraburkholderia sp. DGU8]|uniref:hypothetical protein n=1 Tax=Paraburkholderia sp. DGU8 TaxID=3161997 RepID=UPI003467C31F